MVIGLGNPGMEYTRTRHNAGFRVVDRVARDLGAGAFAARGQALVATGACADEPMLLVKPQTYMNRSGEAVGALLKPEGESLPIDRLLVIADDLHLPLGRLRFRDRGSCGGHNGLASIEQALATDAYPRLRLGIGPRLADAATSDGTPLSAAEPEGQDPVDFVLGAFSEDEEAVLATVIATASEAVRTWVTAGLSHCQNQYNGWQVDP